MKASRAQARQALAAEQQLETIAALAAEIRTTLVLGGVSAELVDNEPLATAADMAALRAQIEGLISNLAERLDRLEAKLDTPRGAVPSHQQRSR